MMQSRNKLSGSSLDFLHGLLVKSKVRSPNDISVLDNRMHNSFVEAKHHSAVKVPKHLLIRPRMRLYSSGNCIMGMIMKTQIWVNPDTQVFLLNLSVEVITVEFNI